MKQKFNLKLRSGALQLTVFIAILIALLLTALILYAYTFGYMKEQSKAAIEIIRLSSTGISALTEQSEINSDTLTISPNDQEHYSIKTNLSQWGIFEKGFTSVQHRTKMFKKLAIIGSLINTEKSPTLYLQETQNALSIVGNTKIKGIAYLPIQGVKTGYIAGNSYYGSQLIYGEIKKSTPSLPKINERTIKAIVNYLKDYQPTSPQDYINIETNQKIRNSFKEKTKASFSKTAIVLENKQIIGNIIIKSDSLITVKRTTVLKDIILIAPRIEIEDGTVGNFQAIASIKITVGPNCSLSYPSALVLYQDNKDASNTPPPNKDDNQIYIATRTNINGSVCYLHTNEADDFSTQIILESQAKIKGQLYCMGNLELKGTVSGSVFTKQFVANQSGSIFMNHIYNGVIENENIPAFFGGVIFENEPKIVMKWLY